jgi:hypothetical protein
MLYGRWWPGGSPLKCPRCQHDNPQGARFCEECATPLARTCSNCGTALSATAKFCHACAHPVAAVAARRRGLLTATRPSTSPRNPDVQNGAGGRTQTGHRALRRPEGLNGDPSLIVIPRRRRTRRPRPRADAGCRAPLRRHGQSRTAAKLGVECALQRLRISLDNCVVCTVPGGGRTAR